MTGVVMDASTFESGMDGWTTGGTNQPFTHGVGSTKSASTGPQGAADGAYYVYTETSSPNYPNKTFEMEKTFPTNQALYGVAFKYHMYGASMGSAVLETSADGASWLSLWSKSGDQGNQWLQATAYAGSGQTMLRYRCHGPRLEVKRSMVVTTT